LPDATTLVGSGESVGIERTNFGAIAIGFSFNYYFKAFAATIASIAATGISGGSIKSDYV
jgi:hypothetical protein